MFRKILSAGDKIDLTKINTRNKENSKVQYASQIVDFTDDKQLCIAMPIEKGRIVVMDVGDKYNLYFYTKRGMYHSKCIVTGRKKTGNIFTATVKFLTDLEKFQRRQYFRLDCLLDIQYRVLSIQEIKDIIIYNQNVFSTPKEKQEFFNKLVDYDKNYSSGVMIDLSGGGLRFNTSEDIEKGSRIMVKINFPEKELQLMATVIMTTKIMNQNGRYEHRAEFFGISTEDRELLIRYIFDEERKKRRRENEY